jgi:predicted dehydrogenase
MAYRQLNRSFALTDQLKVDEGVNILEKYKIDVYPDINSALDQEPDIAFICTPSNLHIPVALMAARAGCRLFIEKPLSHNLDFVSELIQVIEQKKLASVVGYQMRFNPCLMRIKTLLSEKAIGRVISVRAEVGDYLPAWHQYEDYRQLYASRSELGGGVILTQIHELDYLFWMFGLPNRVYAAGGHLSELELDVEDMVDILMEYDTLKGTMIVNLHMDFVQRPTSRSCTVMGTKGKIHADLKESTLVYFDSLGNVVESTSFREYDRNLQFLDEIKLFLESEKGVQYPLVTVREASQSLRMALAVKESMLSGKVVLLEGQVDATQ